MAELLITKGLRKVYRRKQGGDVEVLKGVDFTLMEGEKVAILGRSGAGKSTMLHLLGTLESPSSGSLVFQGKDVFALNDKKLSHFRNHSLGFVFQFHYLMLEFNALENTLMPALITGMAKPKAEKRATELLERVGLGHRLTHKPSQLSGGEQQRVAIARALMMSPKLLLTDEMTGNLDSVTGRQIFDLVAELHRESSMAMVSVTHDEVLAKSYDRCYRLDAGILSPA